MHLVHAVERNAKNTTVQRPSEMAKEPWFLEAIQEEPDMLYVDIVPQSFEAVLKVNLDSVLVGHMSVNMVDSEWATILLAIRAVHPTTPVFIFGGHTHVRSCERLDTSSITFASGRYMETVGWVS